MNLALSEAEGYIVKPDKMSVDLIAAPADSSSSPA